MTGESLGAHGESALSGAGLWSLRRALAAALFAGLMLWLVIFKAATLVWLAMAGLW